MRCRLPVLRRLFMVGVRALCMVVCDGVTRCRILRDRAGSSDRHRLLGCQWSQRGSEA
uniref:Uncharacterized protein n=1 Tax=Arundo donax TaxID=35708 RepID=A0A0A8XS02_ARUDO